MSLLKLKEYRLKSNLSQNDIAKMFGLTQQAYSTWEVGRAYPNAEQLLKLANIFGCTPNDLYEHL